MSQNKEASDSVLNIAQRRNATLPAYHRLYVLISDAIKDGIYPVGHLLPSENAMVEIHKMSRVTVRRALEQLVEDGLVTKHHGQGTVVAERKGIAEEDEGHLGGVLADLVAQGEKFSAKTLMWQLVEPSEFVRQKLDLKQGEKCLLIRRIRSLKDLPISYGSIYLPEYIGSQLSEKEAEKDLIIRMLDETEYAAERSEHFLSASLAEGECADLLALPVGSPVIRMRGVAYAENGTPVYCQDSKYHPERYEYSVRFGKDDPSGKMVWLSKE